MATNEEMLVRKQFPSDLLLNWKICSAMSANDLIPFWEQKIKNSRLAAILNLGNFVILKWLKKMQIS